MYKLTVIGSDEAIYDSVSNPLPESEVYFHTHQILWKDDIQIGRVFIGSKFVKLMLGSNNPITIPRDKFQELFMKDAQIVEMIFSAHEVSRAKLFPGKEYKFFLKNKYRAIRLCQKIGDKFMFYADLVYELK